MNFEINWLAVFVSSFSAFVIGAIWFGPKTFYPIWVKAQGREVPTQRVDMKLGETLLMFGGTYVGALMQIITLACILSITRMAGYSVDVWSGAIYGFLASVGFGAFASLSHRMFGQGDHKVYKSIKVWLIEVGQDALSLTVAGLILGAWV